jgi:hypothetical protein
MRTRITAAAAIHGSGYKLAKLLGRPAIHVRILQMNRHRMKMAIAQCVKGRHRRHHVKVLSLPDTNFLWPTSDICAAGITVFAISDRLQFQLLAKPLDRAEHEELSFTQVAIVVDIVLSCRADVQVSTELQLKSLASRTHPAWC